MANEKGGSEFLYTGKIESAKIDVAAGQRLGAPKAELARAIAVDVLSGHLGSYRSSGHFTGRMKLRNFDVLDIAYAIRGGRCVLCGEYSLLHDNYKYCFVGDVDGVDLKSVFAISALHNYLKSPLVSLITGCWDNKTGVLKRR